MATNILQPVDLWRGKALSPSAISCEESLLRELRELALESRDTSGLGGVLFESLRKNLGASGCDRILEGMVALLERGEPAGVRLLAGFLDVATPASRLLPRVRNLTSSRRLYLARIRDDERPGAVLEDWRDRLEGLRGRCDTVLADRSWQPSRPGDRPGWEEPWGAMRTVLGRLLREASARGSLDPTERRLLADLLRLEIDALQERVSHLAGTVDPYRVAVITRLLPILSDTDADIRDLRGIVTQLEEGHIREALTVPRLRAFEILDEKEFRVLLETMERSGSLGLAAALLEAQRERPLPVQSLAYGAARLMTIAGLLAEAGLRAGSLGLAEACLLILRHHAEGEAALEIPVEISEQVAELLHRATEREDFSSTPEPGPSGWPLGGVDVLVGQLVVVLPPEGADFPAWPHYLPTAGDYDPLLALAIPGLGVHEEAQPREAVEDGAEEDESQDETLSAASMKNLVLTNIQSTSLVLGFLRNPKFVAIPGLVEAVAVRTRNPRVIETIATDRTLHTGFANRGVALACLRSPVNVSVKILRKFVHVKYVSKVDLKRMAQDKAGIRKEVLREIQKYLETLA